MSQYLMLGSLFLFMAVNMLAICLFRSINMLDNSSQRIFAMVECTITLVMMIAYMASFDQHEILNPLMLYPVAAFDLIYLYLTRMKN